MNHTNQPSRSAWSRFNDIQSLQIHKFSSRTTKEIIIPGSKSFTNRALILAAFSEGTSLIKGILKSDDSYWCMDALRKLGAQFDISDDRVKVKGIANHFPIDSQELYIGSAGTVARFLPGILGTNRHANYTIYASEQLSQRPIKPLIKGLAKLGVQIDFLEEGSSFPIKISRPNLLGREIAISGKESSQYISGLLMCSPFFNEPVTIKITDYIVQHAYVQLTIDLMRAFGVKVIVSEKFDQFLVKPQKYVSDHIHLEADASTASYFMAFAALNKSTVTIKNLGTNSKQPDLKMANILKQMGCDVQLTKNNLTITGPDQLLGGFSFNMRELSDQALTLAALAPFANEKITVTHVKHIRQHESDRISVMADSLRQLGAKVLENEDGWDISPSSLQSTKKALDTYDDHRVAMSLALIGTKIGGLSLNDPGCVSKTCPEYFNILESLGVDIDY